MDILGACDPSLDQKDNINYDNLNQTPLEDWVQIAIDLEEKQ